jgi:uncharacterized membrane protein
MDSFTQLVAGTATLLTGLLAGLLYAYWCSVNPGLARMPDTIYLHAMQSINRAILNPWFFLTFLGAMIFLLLAAWRLYAQGFYVSFSWMLAAGLVYVAGVFLVTGAGNVPLNEKLAATDLTGMSDEQLRALRNLIEGPWNRYHIIRTLASIVAFILSLIAILRSR